MIAAPNVASYWRRQRFIVAVVVAVVTTGGYLVLLGWHELPGYRRSHVAYLGLVLVLLAAWAGWRRPFVVGSLILTATLVMLWSLDAATAPSDGTNLWPVGAIMLAVTTAAGAFVVSWPIWALRTAQLRSAMGSIAGGGRDT